VRRRAARRAGGDGLSARLQAHRGDDRRRRRRGARNGVSQRPEDRPDPVAPLGHADAGRDDDGGPDAQECLRRGGAPRAADLLRRGRLREARLRVRRDPRAGRPPRR
ncbi:MAG: hypothetical protein ACK55Z_25145, partial [bacterium]